MAGDAGGHRGGLVGLVAGLALSVWAGGPQAGAGASRPRGALPPAVARYLARWEAPPAVAPLLEELRHRKGGDWQVRVKAVAQLRRLGHPSAIGGLIGALDDPEWFVVVKAIDALAAICDPIALPHVARLAKSHFPPIYDHAARACHKLAQAPRDKYAAAWKLVDRKAVALELLDALRLPGKEESAVTERYRIALTKALASLAAKGAPAPLTDAGAYGDGALLGLAVRMGEYRLAARLVGHQGAVGSLAFSPDGKQLASASADGTIRLWDSMTGTCRCILRGHTLPPRAVLFSRDGKRLVSGGSDGTLRLWDAASGKCLKSVDAKSGPIRSIAMPWDGACVAVAGTSGRVRVWDSDDFRLLMTLRGIRGEVRAVAFSPDGNTVLCAGDELSAWEPHTGRRVKPPGAPRWPMSCAASSVDGKRVVSAQKDGTLRLSDAAGGKSLAVLEARGGRVTCVTLAPEGTRIASGSADGTVRIWTVGPPDPIELHRVDERRAKQIAAAMRTRITLDFADKPLRDVLAFIALSAQATFVLDDGLLLDDEVVWKKDDDWDADWDRRAAKPREATLTLRVDAVPLSEALDRICRLTGRTHAVCHGAVLVATPERMTRALRVNEKLREHQSPPRDDLDSAVKLALGEISFDFVETPLADAVSWLDSRFGLPVILDAGAFRDGAPCVTLKASGMRLENALRWLCRVARVVYVWLDGAVFITTPECAREALARERHWSQLARPSDKATTAALAKPVSFDFVETPLQDAVAFLAAKTTMHLFLDTAAIRDKAPTVTLKTKAMPLGRALRWIGRLVGLVPVWVDGAVFITTPPRARHAIRHDRLRRRLPPPPGKRLAAEMKKPVSFDFIETPLQDVVAFLRTLAEVDLALDPKAKKGEWPCITLKVAQMRHDRAVRWVCRLAGLVPVWREGTLLLTSPALAREEIIAGQAWRRFQRAPSPQLAELMARKLGMEFVRRPLKDALAFISTLTKLTFVLDPKLAEDQLPPVTVNARDLPLDRAIWAICRSAGLIPTWRDASILITRPPADREDRHPH